MRHHFAEGRLADHQHIDIALGPLPAAGDRSINEGNGNPLRQWGQSAAENIGRAHRFGEKALISSKTSRAGLEVDLVAANGGAGKPGLGELLQFALDRSHSAAGEWHDLPQIELLVGMSEKQREHRTVGLAEKCSAKETLIGDCNHNWFNCTILWCDCQTHRQTHLGSRHDFRD